MKFLIQTGLICVLFAALVLFLPAGGSGEGGGRYSVYFTSPTGRSVKRDIHNNPETRLVSIINGARNRFYGAFYDLTSERVVQALIRARKRGVDVRIVTEQDNIQGSEIIGLINEGVPVVADNRSGLMHNKFAVIDDAMVWTGSYNLTYNGAWKNNNNAVIIKLPELAEIFNAEFMEMYRDRIFGNRKEQGPFGGFGKKYYVRAGGTHINAYFAPEDNVERIILKRIRGAKSSIHFMAFSFTSDGIGEAVIKKFHGGLEVKGIFERSGTGNRYSEYVKMKIEGVPVKVDRNRNSMHHKVFIIDRRIVITGSYNFSKNANKKNDENILIFEDRNIADEYLREFRRLYR